MSFLNKVKLETVENDQNEDDIEYNLDEFERLYNGFPQTTSNEMFDNLKQESFSSEHINKFEQVNSLEQIPVLDNYNNLQNYDNLKIYKSEPKEPFEDIATFETYEAANDFDAFHNFQEFKSSDFYEFNL